MNFILLLVRVLTFHAKLVNFLLKIRSDAFCRCRVNLFVKNYLIFLIMVSIPLLLLLSSKPVQKSLPMLFTFFLMKSIKAFLHPLHIKAIVLSLSIKMIWILYTLLVLKENTCPVIILMRVMIFSIIAM